MSAPWLLGVGVAPSSDRSGRPGRPLSTLARGIYRTGARTPTCSGSGSELGWLSHRLGRPGARHRRPPAGPCVDVTVVHRRGAQPGLGAPAPSAAGDRRTWTWSAGCVSTSRGANSPRPRPGAAAAGGRRRDGLALHAAPRASRGTLRCRGSLTRTGCRADPRRSRGERPPSSESPLETLLRLVTGWRRASSAPAGRHRGQSASSHVWTSCSPTRAGGRGGRLRVPRRPGQLPERPPARERLARRGLPGAAVQLGGRGPAAPGGRRDHPAHGGSAGR